MRGFVPCVSSIALNSPFEAYEAVGQCIVRSLLLYLPVRKCRDKCSEILKRVEESLHEHCSIPAIPEARIHCRKSSSLHMKTVQNEGFEILKKINVDALIETLKEVISKPTEEVKDDDASGTDSEEERSNLIANQGKKATQALKLSERKSKAKKQRTIETSMKMRPHTFVIKNYTRSKLSGKEKGGKLMQFRGNANSGYRSTAAANNRELRGYVMSEQRVGRKCKDMSFDKTRAKRLPAIKDILLEKYSANSSEPYSSFKKIMAVSQKKSSTGLNPEGKKPFNSIDDNMSLIHIRTVQRNSKSSTGGKNCKNFAEAEQSDFGDHLDIRMWKSNKKMLQKCALDVAAGKWTFIGSRVGQGVPGSCAKK